jgi:hypothetical protein
MRQRLLERPWLALLVAAIVYVALFLALQRDLSASDPLWYAARAHELAFHPARLFAAHNNYPFVMRLGLTGPIALAYRLFGVSTLTTNLPCLLAGLGTLGLAYAAPSTPRGKALAVLFALLCTPLVADAHELAPDLPCAAVMAASVLCLSRRARPRGPGWVAAAVAIWFAAFQIKEVALWLAPVWGYAVIGDLRHRGRRWVARTFAPALVLGAALAAGYLALCAALWGDPLARFHGIDDAASTHEWSLVGKPAAAWIARLTWQPALLLWHMFRVALVPVVASPWLVRRRDRIWIVAAASIVLLYWFGSATATIYLPLPILRRMMLPALPAIVVVAALATDAALDRGAGARVLAAVLAVCLAVPSVHVVLTNLAAVARPEEAAFAALRREVTGTTERVVLVCGDPRCPPIAAFYFGFDPPAHLDIVMAADFAAAPPPHQARVRLFTHLSRAGGVARPIAQTADVLALPAIVWHPELRLYDAGDGARLHAALAATPSRSAAR